MSTVPGACGGVLAEIVPDPATVTTEAGAVPNVTDAPAEKPEPEMVTPVPPAVPPEEGVIAVTDVPRSY